MVKKQRSKLVRLFKEENNDNTIRYRKQEIFKTNDEWI